MRGSRNRTKESREEDGRGGGGVEEMKVTMIMDSITEHLNMKQEEKKNKHAGSTSNTSHRCNSQHYPWTAQDNSLLHTHTHVYTHTAYTNTTLCTPLLTQALQVLLTIHTIATSHTHSAVHSLSLRIMTLSLNQTHTTTRTMIKQTSSQSPSIAYLCTTSLVESN